MLKNKVERPVIPRVEKVKKELLELDKLSPKTVTGYHNIFYQYEEFLKGKKPTLKNANQFLGSKSFLKASSLSTYRMALRTYLNKLGIEIPKGELKPLKFNNVREDKFVTRKEVDTLYRCADKLRDKMGIRLLYHGGLRASELLNLQIGDLDLDNEKINVRGLKGSNEIRRVRLILPELVRPAVRDYLKQRGINPDKITKAQRKEYLMLGMRGGKLAYTRLWENVSKLGETIGKPDLSPHWLRHGHVVWCKVHGIPPESTARNIGDTVETTMKIYSHYSEDDRDRDFDKAMKGEALAPGDKNPLYEIEELKDKNETIEEKNKELEERMNKLEMALDLLSEAVKWEKEKDTPSSTSR